MTVHHGGAGTLNAALRSGSPTIITPVFFDQFDHAYVVEKLGVGVGFSKQLQQISVDELVDAIKKVASNEDVIGRSLQIADEIKKETRKFAVVDEIEKMLSEINDA